MRRNGVAESAARRWTRPDAYVDALVRRRNARRRRSPRRDRTEPEAPRLLLSTVPFLALIAVLGVLAVLIMVVAFPGSQPGPRPPQMAQKELGVASKGWLQEAEKEFH